MKTIKEAFDHHFKDLKINDNFVRDLEGYLKSILTKNEDTISFFGSPLVGVHKVYFDRADTNYLWGVLVEADMDDVKGSLHSVPYIKPHWNVGGDVTNHLLSYLIHRVLTSSLAESKRHSCAITLLFILQYKFVTSLLYRDYPHPVDKELALTVYNKLSNRFILRQVDSWRELLFTQASNMLHGTDKRKDMQSILVKYDSDKLVTDNITGISSNLNDMFKEYNAVFHRVKDETDKITLDSGLGKNGEGEVSFKDNLTNPAKYHQYLESTISKLDTWMNTELIEAITKANKSRYKPVRKTLAYISDNYGKPKHDHIREFVNTSLMFGINKLKDEDTDMRNIRDVYDLLSGSFSSSRSLDPTLEYLKEQGSRIVMSGTSGKSFNNTVTLTRTTVMLYIVIFTLVNA